MGILPIKIVFSIHMYERFLNNQYQYHCAVQIAWIKMDVKWAVKRNVAHQFVYPFNWTQCKMFWSTKNTNNAH